MSTGHLRAKGVKSCKKASVEKPNDFHLNTFQWKFQVRNIRKCATNALGNCAFATEKAEGCLEGGCRKEVVKPISRAYNYVYESANLTATTAAAKRQEVVKWPVRILYTTHILPSLHPSSVRNFLSRGCTRCRCSGGLFARLRAKLNEVKTVAQIITHLSLRYDPFRLSPPRPAWEVGVRSPISGAHSQRLQPIVQLPVISYFGIKSKCQSVLTCAYRATPPPPPTFSCFVRNCSVSWHAPSRVSGKALSLYCWTHSPSLTKLYRTTSCSRCSIP